MARPARLRLFCLVRNAMVLELLASILQATLQMLIGTGDVHAAGFTMVLSLRRRLPERTHRRFCQLQIVYAVARHSSGAGCRGLNNLGAKLVSPVAPSPSTGICCRRCLALSYPLKLNCFLPWERLRACAIPTGKAILWSSANFRLVAMGGKATQHFRASGSLSRHFLCVRTSPCREPSPHMYGVVHPWCGIRDMVMAKGARGRIQGRMQIHSAITQLHGSGHS